MASDGARVAAELVIELDSRRSDESVVVTSVDLGNQLLYTGLAQRPTPTTYVPHGNGELTWQTSHNGSPSTATSPSPSGRPAAAAVVFQGTFRLGKRTGRGTIRTASYALTCDWDDDMPSLGGQLCHLRSLRNGEEYVGMISMITDGSLTTRGSFEGLSWVERVKFLPDSCGEMYAPSERRRYCGEWQCGQRHGFGIETDTAGTYTFVGGYQYDVREGPGTVFQSQQRTVLSGSWSDGAMRGPASLHLACQTTMLQSQQWTNVDRLQFDSATLLRSRLVDGTWEPLFVAFDSTLALSVAESTTTSSPLAAAAAAAADVSTRTASGISPKTRFVVNRLEDIVKQDDFAALLAAFQRCFYFMYGSCERFLASQQQTVSSPRTTPSSSSPNLPGVEAAGGGRSGASGSRKGARAITVVAYPESGCCVAGLSVTECLHTYAKERPCTSATFRQAIADLASFVFSIRLRLLSYLAAMPTSCDVNVGRSILELCWDCAFGAVEGLVLHMAQRLSKTNHASLTMASRRCEAAQLGLEDFVGSLDLWFRSGVAEVSPSAAAPEPSGLEPGGTEERGASRSVPLLQRAAASDRERFLAELKEVSSLFEDHGFLQSRRHSSSSIDRASNNDEGNRESDENPVEGGELVMEAWSAASGPLVLVAEPHKIRLSSYVAFLAAATRCVREASKIAARGVGGPISLEFLQEQLMHFIVLQHCGTRRSFEALLTTLCVMLSDDVDPPLPGAAGGVAVSSSPRGPPQPPSAAIDATRGHSPVQNNNNSFLSSLDDSMDGMALLSTSERSDRERQSALQTRYLLWSWLRALHRAASVWPSLRICRWGCVVPLDDVKLRVQHLLLVTFAKQVASASALSDSDDEGDELSPLTASSSPAAAAEGDVSVWRKKPLPLPSSRVVAQELDAATAPDAPQPTCEVLLWVLESVPILLSKLQMLRLAASTAPTHASSLSTSSSGIVVSFKKAIRARLLDPGHWYRDVIPRCTALSAFLLHFLCIRMTVKFVSGNGSTEVPPEDAAHLILELTSSSTTKLLRPLRSIADGASFTSFVLHAVIEVWDQCVMHTYSAWKLLSGHAQRSRLQ